jgi:hypothetical protein
VFDLIEVIEGLWGEGVRVIDERILSAEGAEEFERLGYALRKALFGWIEATLVHTKRRVFCRGSRALKRDFEHDSRGFCLSDDLFKRALRAAGFEPINPDEEDWRFRAKPRCELSAAQRRKLRWVGPGWLDRDPDRAEGFPGAA